MSEAIKSIVDTYIRLGTCQPLEDMLDHRRSLSRQLQFRSLGAAFDVSALTSLIDVEIAVIEQGIERIKSPHSAINSEERSAIGLEKVSSQSVSSKEPNEAHIVRDTDAVQPDPSRVRDRTPDSVVADSSTSVVAEDPLVDTIIGLIQQPREPRAASPQMGESTVPLAEEPERFIFREESAGKITYRWATTSG